MGHCHNFPVSICNLFSTYTALRDRDYVSISAHKGQMCQVSDPQELWTIATENIITAWIASKFHKAHQAGTWAYLLFWLKCSCSSCRSQHSRGPAWSTGRREIPGTAQGSSRQDPPQAAAPCKCFSSPLCRANACQLVYIISVSKLNLLPAS